MNIVKTFFAASALGLFAGAASAATIPYGVDDLLGSDTLANSSVETELTWLAGLLGTTYESLEFVEKYETSDNVFFINDDSDPDNRSYYFDIAPETVGYFILKFGTGNVEDTHYAFRNIAELDKLVWSDDQTNGLLSNCEFGGLYSSAAIGSCSLSHITTVIPLPAAGWLLLGGLGGLAALRRRNKV